MNKFTRISALVFALCLSAALMTGCGSSPESKKDSSKTAADKTQTEKQTEVQESVPEKVDESSEPEEVIGGPYDLHSRVTDEVLYGIYARPGFELSYSNDRILEFRNADDIEYEVSTEQQMYTNQYGEDREWSYDYIRNNGKTVQIADGEYRLAHGGEYYVSVYYINDYHRTTAPHENKYDVTEEFLNGVEIKGYQEYILYALIDLGYTMKGVDGNEYPVYAIKPYSLGKKDETTNLRPGFARIVFRNGERNEGNQMDIWTEVLFDGEDVDDWTKEDFQQAFCQIFGKE